MLVTHLLLLAERDLGDSPSNFAGNKRFTATRTLMIEQDAIATMHIVRLPVVHYYPVSIQLGHP